MIYMKTLFCSQKRPVGNPGMETLMSLEPFASESSNPDEPARIVTPYVLFLICSLFVFLG
jgi:hypothetical protein